MHLPKYSWIVRLKFSPLLTSFICTLRWHWPCSLRQNTRRPAVNWISSKSLVTLVWSHSSHLPVPNSWNVSSWSSRTEGMLYALVGNMRSMLRKAAESEDSLSSSSQETQKVTYCELVGNYTKCNCRLTVFFSLLDLFHKYVLLNDIYVNITLY